MTEARHGLRGGLVRPSGPPQAVRLASRAAWRRDATRYFHWYSMPAPITF
ncbi:hypothetical protein LGN21_33730 [Burkholderia cepacia]|nr:hypothetical protein [Burkholderia cepacia]MCA8284554.1 hypothetical protein [Burkholderia cepacia]